ncbi:MAG: B12-binding domain-containing radical SAM protein [Bdellovibrio sp.]
MEISTSQKLVTLIRPAAMVRKFSLSNVLTPPIGIAYLAGTLLKNGIDSKIIDATGEALKKFTYLEYAGGYSVGLTNHEIVDRIDANTDIIGVSCMFSSSWPNDSRLIDLIRSRFPNATIILGGEHVTACCDYILQYHSSVDFCVKGEGEQTLLELIHAIRSQSDVSNVAGVVRRSQGKIVHNNNRKRIVEIDLIPKPAWHLVPLENYLSNLIGHGVSSQRSMPLLASRGCPYQCTFCSSAQMWTTRWIARDVKHVVDEMEEYIQTYHVKNFDLYDLTAIIRKDWLIAFAQEITRRNLQITYQLPSGTRSEAIDKEVAEWLKKSGCTHLNYAPESGSERTLKKIKKKVNLDNLLKSLKYACDQDIKVMCNIILFPHETPRDVLHTFGLMFKMARVGLHDITFVPFVPYPGTELYEELKRQKKIADFSEEHFKSLLIHSDLLNANSYNPYFGPKAVVMIRLLFLGSFYMTSLLLRPQRIYFLIKNIITNDPQTRGEGGLRFLVQKVLRLS